MNDMPDELIARYVAGRCSPVEEAQVRQWIGADPERQALVDSLTRVWELGELPLSKWDARGAWADLVARRAVQSRLPVRSAKVPSAGLGWPVPSAGPFRIAAALVITVGAALLWRTISRDPAPVSQAPQVTEYVTRPGQRAELRLADGTKVLLNVDSRIRVVSTFGVENRDLWLEGEAFFDVRHDPAHPFQVRTARGVAEDLGTKFVVTAYPESHGMQVAVVSGVVGFRRPASLSPREAGSTTGESDVLVRLTGGDLARLDSAGAPHVERSIDLTPYTAWTTGNLVFESEPLGDAVVRLGRWYDVDIRLADPELAERRLTASFQNERLSHVLDILALSFNLRFERRGRVVMLAPKGRF